MEQYPIMPGVSRQVLGVHSGEAVTNHTGQPIAMDRRDCLTDNKIELPHELTCTHLVHFTENESAARIGLSSPTEFVFRARQVDITSTVSLPLTWWSPLPPDNYSAVIANDLPNVDVEYYDIGNSAAFNGNSLCGPIGIVVKWIDIVTAYANSRQKPMTDVEYRVLGTFHYKREIMYGILVCMRGDANVGRFPISGADGTEAFKRVSETDFIWKVFSTIGYTIGARPQGVYWTWDHLSFGFNCPSSTLNIPNQFCSIRTKMATSYKPSSRSDGNNRPLDDRVPNDDICDRLISKST